MKTIDLTQGFQAIVDDEDFEKLSHFKWHVRIQPGIYAARTMRENKRRFNIRMHQQIMGTIPGYEIDHINGNGLDNRRSNLRFCTRSENMMNQKKQLGTSQYKGVSFASSKAKWHAQIVNKRHRISLGYFRTELCAALAYDVAALLLFGEFARINFPQGMSALLSPGSAGVTGPRRSFFSSHEN